LHRFLTRREADGVKPIIGFTANILIHIAVLGYACAPGFEFNLPDAPMPAQQIARALLAPTSRLQLACEREDVNAD
ncbi:hypothetical protein M405DRAFT_692710, partial [Rhizopogon salebrosus TDB-379]